MTISLPILPSLVLSLPSLATINLIPIFATNSHITVKLATITLIPKSLLSTLSPSPLSPNLYCQPCHHQSYPPTFATINLITISLATLNLIPQSLLPLALSLSTLPPSTLSPQSLLPSALSLQALPPLAYHQPYHCQPCHHQLYPPIVKLVTISLITVNYVIPQSLLPSTLSLVNLATMLSSYSSRPLRKTLAFKHGQMQ